MALTGCLQEQKYVQAKTENEFENAQAKKEAIYTSRNIDWFHQRFDKELFCARVNLFAVSFPI